MQTDQWAEALTSRSEMRVAQSRADISIYLDQSDRKNRASCVPSATFQCPTVGPPVDFHRQTGIAPFLAPSCLAARAEVSQTPRACVAQMIREGYTDEDPWNFSRCRSTHRDCNRKASGSAAADSKVTCFSLELISEIFITYLSCAS